MKKKIISAINLTESLRQMTIEKLEGVVWAEPNYDSHLVVRCHELRKIPLNQFSIEDLRIMIGQEIGLPYLMPLAIEQLSKNLFAEGDFYEGDLLKNVLTVDGSFWSTNPNLWQTMSELLKDRNSELESKDISFASFIASQPK